MSTAVWLVFLALTALHIFANVRAMRCLQLRSLNRPRLALLLRSYRATQARSLLFCTLTLDSERLYKVLLQSPSSNQKQPFLLPVGAVSLVAWLLSTNCPCCVCALACTVRQGCFNPNCQFELEASQAGSSPLAELQHSAPTHAVRVYERLVF